jgi:hypothetical protein
MGSDSHGQISNIGVITFMVPITSLYTKGVLIVASDGLVLAITTRD